MWWTAIGAVGLLCAGCGPRAADVLPGSGSEALDTAASAPDGRLRCGNELAPDAWLALQAELAGDAVYQSALAAARGGTGRRAGRDIDVHVHVLHDGAAGGVSSALVERQIDVLNYDFAYTGWRFDLASLSYVNSAEAHRCVRSGQPSIAPAWHPGGPGDLILYVCDTGPWLGVTLALPWNVAQSPLWDGVLVDWRTRPGGSFEYDDRGHTATHEVGHWMGLFHTHQGSGCSEPGDEVADTPPELRPAWECDLDRDSCPGDGPDPVQNFMDYGDDDCVREFTPGQAARMDAMYATYRR